MRKETITRTLQIIGVILIIWLILALRTSWTVADEYNKMLLQEHGISEQLRLKLDSCEQKSRY